MEKSHCYNPFAYLETDNDVQKLVTNLFKATTPKGSQSQDPFWDTAASMLLLALIFYLRYEAPPDEQNFPMVMEMLRAGEVREDDDSYQSPLDELFERLEMRDPEHIAVKYYKDYHSGSAKTLKSIQITLAARLEKFNLSSVASLTMTDELDLPSLGEKKVALFALIPDHDVSFNFLVSMLYGSTFEQLFRLADHEYGGALPVPVHFLMDEFANVSLPDDFDKLLATMRSRNISVSIIIQNIAQLKALFEKQWESIMGNTDEFLLSGRQRNWNAQADFGILPGQANDKYQHLWKVHRAQRQLQHQLSEHGPGAVGRGGGAYAGQPLCAAVHPRGTAHHGRKV